MYPEPVEGEKLMLSRKKQSDSATKQYVFTSNLLSNFLKTRYFSNKIKQIIIHNIATMRSFFPQKIFPIWLENFLELEKIWERNEFFLEK